MYVSITGLDKILIDCPQVSSGRDADVWDMFVGSEIDILGKKTIVKQCDVKTAE